MGSCTGTGIGIGIGIGIAFADVVGLVKSSSSSGKNILTVELGCPIGLKPDILNRELGAAGGSGT